jgi:hypothetical protein
VGLPIRVPGRIIRDRRAGSARPLSELALR